MDVWEMTRMRTHLRRIVWMAILAAPAYAQQAWEPFGALPGGARTGAVGMNHRGAILVVGGRPFVGPDLQASAHYLRPGDNVWRTGTPLDGPIVHQGGGIDSLGRPVVFGGFEPHAGWTREGYVYDLKEGPTDGIADMPAWRIYFAGCADGEGRLYCIGGQDLLGHGTRTVYRFDARTDQWSELAPMPQERFYAAAVYDGRGHVLVVGGYDMFKGRRESSVFSYDIAADRWELLADVPHTGVSLPGLGLGADGKVYCIGGYTGQNPNSGTISRLVYVFDPDTRLWSAGPALTQPREHPAVVLSDDGYLYAIGGYQIGVGTDTVERLKTGEGGGGVPCEDVSKLTAKCLGSGRVKGKVILRDRRHSGENVTIEIDGQPFSPAIKGRKAKFAECCFQGAIAVALIDPGDCLPPEPLTCP
ncbi:MAG: hypothetical protein C4547_08685 [Phycisphaerales bacterium]|nr:MAG: hypothetical protein C4547_08685 [Phycisphaerales bacterium]